MELSQELITSYKQKHICCSCIKMHIKDIATLKCIKGKMWGYSTSILFVIPWRAVWSVLEVDSTEESCACVLSSSSMVVFSFCVSSMIFISAFCCALSVLSVVNLSSCSSSNWSCAIQSQRTQSISPISTCTWIKLCCNVTSCQLRLNFYLAQFFSQCFYTPFPIRQLLCFGPFDEILLQINSIANVSATKANS